jgi:N-acetyl-gamma-glutamyl-phosphate reductase/acetylglutamate kinase
LAATHVQAIEARCNSTGTRLPLLIDLSADMRFEATSQGWVYGLPERLGARDAIRSARRISNPGCYATGAQTALMPLCASSSIANTFGFVWDPAHKPHIFGVSGYSGAGTSPSDKNDPNRLRDNLLPYALVNHIHEREISLHCGFTSNSSSGKSGGKSGVAFMPHVAPFFQGISLTVTGHLLPTSTNGDLSKVTVADIHKVFVEYYKNDRLISISPLGVTPDVKSHQDSSNVHGVTVGGFSYDPATGRVAIVSCIDNLLKGAATQAVQNINLALGIDELAGISLK